MEILIIGIACRARDFILYSTWHFIVIFRYGIVSALSTRHNNQIFHLHRKKHTEWEFQYFLKDISTRCPKYLRCLFGKKSSTQKYSFWSWFGFISNCYGVLSKRKSFGEPIVKSFAISILRGRTDWPIGSENMNCRRSTAESVATAKVHRH